MATYQRLTLAQRYLIQTLHQQKQTQQLIAQQVGVSQSTISRELAKVCQQYPGQVYQAQQAQQRAVAAKSRFPYKLTSDLLTHVINRLRDRLSPQQICGELWRKTSRKTLHHETIYRYIYRHQTLGNSQSIDHETLIEYLRIRHRKRYKDRSKPTKRQLIPNRVSIDLRPPIVETNRTGGPDGVGPLGSGHGYR